MNKNIVRIQTEMFKAGAVMCGPIIDVYLDPPSNAVWWPQAPRFTLIEEPDSVLAQAGKTLRFEEGCFFFSFAALGTEVNGHSNGDIDLLLRTRTAAELFGPDLPHFALMAAERFESFLIQACWAMLAVYEVDVSTGKIDFNASLSLEEVDGEQAEAAEGEAA